MKRNNIFKIVSLSGYFLFLIVSLILEFNPGKEVGYNFVSFSVDMLKILPGAKVLNCQNRVSVICCIGLRLKSKMLTESGSTFQTFKSRAISGPELLIVKAYFIVSPVKTT